MASIGTFTPITATPPFTHHHGIHPHGAGISVADGDFHIAGATRHGIWVTTTIGTTPTTTTAAADGITRSTAVIATPYTLIAMAVVAKVMCLVPQGLQEQTEAYEQELSHATTIIQRHKKSALFAAQATPNAYTIAPAAHATTSHATVPQPNKHAIET